MNLEEKLQRSRSKERIDFSKYQSADKQDPLTRVTPDDKILVEPNWTIPNDFEGKMYADYISEHPEYDGIYVRTELLNKLVQAANTLASPYQLVIRAGHRPIDVQKRLLKECASDFERDNPGTSKEQALDHARMFVSDPDVTLPPHVCGAAVDVEIKDAATGKYLDFGSTMNDDNEKSFLYYPDLTNKQKSSDHSPD